MADDVNNSNEKGKKMKGVVLILLLSCIATSAQSIMRYYPPAGPSLEKQRQMAQERARQEARAHEQQRIRELEEARKTFIPRDPWRVYEGKTNYVRHPDWLHFRGRVVQVHRDGVRVEGWYGDKFDPASDPWRDLATDFFVEGFPYTVADGEQLKLSMDFVAIPDGTHTYTTVLGGQRTIRKLVYGRPTTAPPISEAQLAAIKAAAEAKRTAAEQRRKESLAAALKYHEDLAAKGDAFGQLRMGERYLAGDGVEQDELKAREYLAKAAAQGNADAQAALEKLGPIQISGE